MKTFPTLLVAVTAFAVAVSAQVPQVPTATATPAIAPPSLPPPTVASDAPSSVQGRIVAAETGRPLYRARIRLDAITNAERRINRQTLANRDGRYRFDNVPPGSYSIRASHPGYVELQAGQKQPDEPVAFWKVPAGRLEQIDFTLSRGGLITGRITDDAGEPLAGVTMTPLRLEYTFTGTQWRPQYTPFGNRTDDRGEFRIAGLLPGTYVVAATLQGDAVGEGYATTYYPGTTSQGEARRLKIASNEEVTASFSMMTTVKVRVSGQVQSSTGEMLKRYRAMLTTKTGVDSIGAEINDRTGMFEFKGVSAGSYMLEISPSNGIGGTESEFAVLPLVVGSEDLGGLLVTTGNGVTLSGRVIYEGTPVRDAAISQRPRVYSTQVDGARGFFRRPNPQTNGLIADDGSFSVTGAYGTVVLRTVNLGWQLKSVILDGVDITDVPYDTSRGGTNKLEIFVTDQKQELAGKVVDGTGKPPSKFIVVVFPRNVKPGTVVSRYSPSGTIYGSDGTFRLTGLPPGDYFALALPSAPDNASFDLEFQDALKPRATPFQLSPGESARIELTLIE